MTKARDLSKLLSTSNGKIAGENLDVHLKILPILVLKVLKLLLVQVLKEEAQQVNLGLILLQENLKVMMVLVLKK